MEKCRAIGIRKIPNLGALAFEIFHVWKLVIAGVVDRRYRKQEGASFHEAPSWLASVILANFRRIVLFKASCCPYRCQGRPKILP